MSIYGGASSSAAPSADIEMNMNAADSVQLATKRKASDDLTADETTAMLAAVTWEREQEDKPLQLDEEQEVLEDDDDDVRAIDPAMLQARRDDEMQRLQDFDGCERIREDTYYGEIIKTGWVVARA